MSNSISSISQTPPFPPPTAPRNSGDQRSASTSSQGAATPADDSVTLSDSAQFHAFSQRTGLKVTGGTLGQLFAPAFFASADTNNDARLSSSEFASFIEQNGGNAWQATTLYQAMGGNDKGLSYAQFRDGLGQGAAKDFFNNLVMKRVKGSDSDPTKWLERLCALGDESTAASYKIAAELRG